MATGLFVNNAGTWASVQQVYVNIASTWTQIQQIWVNNAGTWVETYVNFTGSTVTYSTAGSFTETIPSGAVQAVIEVWGGTGCGGAGSGAPGGSGAAGGGGSSGGYARSTYSLTSSNWGQNMAVVVGVGGVRLTNQGGNSTVSSGTYTIPFGGAAILGGGGNNGGDATSGPFVGGAGGTPGGTASGSHDLQAAGSVGTAGTNGSPGTPGTGGAGFAGVNGTGPTGANGAGNGGSTIPGHAGLIIIKYT